MSCCTSIDTVPDGYILGLGRDHPHPKLAHLYHGDFNEPGLAMCLRGYNRGVDGYSIWRGNVGERGICKTCLRRAGAGLPGVPFRVNGIK
jgi:hypothetical protein